MKRRSFFLLISCVCVLTAPAQTPNTSTPVPVAPAPVTPEAVESQAEARERATIERFWAILMKSPRRGTSLERVYGYYADTGQLDALLERVRHLTDQTPNDAKAWLLLGHVLARRGDDAGTIDAFEKAGKFDPADALPLFYLGEALIMQGRLKEAAAALEDSIVRKPVPSDVLPTLQMLGRVYERFGDRAKSDAVWLKMEQMYPDDLVILSQIAETLDEEGKTEEALARYLKLIPMAGKDEYARVRFTLAAADLKIQLGRKQEAIADFEALLERLAEGSWLTASVHERIERIFVRSADHAGLAAYYKKRLDSHPNEIDTVRRLARTLVRLAKPTEAKELIARTLEKAPSNIPLRLALIDLLVHEKNFDEVDVQYAKIEELDPNNPDHISQRGLAALENRNVDESARRASATKIWSRMVAARPNDAAAVVLVADLFAGAGIDAEAEKMYEKAIALRPDDPAYREYLGYFYHRKDQPDKAVATFKQIAEGGRRNVKTLAQLGSVLKGLGYVKDALEALRGAVELEPRDLELRLRLVDLYVATGDLAGAFDGLAAVRESIETDAELERYTISEIAAYQAAKQLDTAAETLLEKLMTDLNTRQPGDSETAAALRTIRESLDRPGGDLFGMYGMSLYGPGRGGETEAPKEPVRVELLPPVPNAPANRAICRELWRLAAFLQTLSRIEPAIDTIETALRLEPESLPLLQSAAALYARGSDEKKAASIYDRLARIDAPRRVEHLKRLAVLQRDLGKIDEAIETARLVMATGAGNAANSRFYADLLLAVGNRAAGIEALRRAARIDPTDATTLNALANALAEDGQPDESIEILWRLFHRAEDLSEKLGIVSRLAQLYQQERQFDRLVGRLKTGVTEAAGRREAAYCTAQAFMTINDYMAARTALEGLLSDAGDIGPDAVKNGAKTSGTDDTQLLTQLSKIAEQMGDLPGAIRYQEMLCESTDSVVENERLISLYQGNNEPEKAKSLYMKMVLAQATLIDRLAAFDAMLAQEEYATAKLLAERVTGTEADDWEFLYRLMQLQYWTGELDAARSTAARLARLELPPDTLSAEKQRLKNLAPKTGDAPTSSPGVAVPTTFAGSRRISYGGMYGGYGGGNSPWMLSGTAYFVSLLQTEGVDGTMLWENDLADILPTIFREYLVHQPNDNPYIYTPYGRRVATPTGPPPKPLFVPDSFADTRLAVRFWEMKFAIDHAAAEAAGAKPAPPENETVAETADATAAATPILVPLVAAGYPAQVYLSKPQAVTFLPVDEVSPQPTQVPKKILGKNLLDWITQARATHPETAVEKSVLLDRLRIEGMIGVLNRFVANGWFVLPGKLDTPVENAHTLLVQPPNDSEVAAALEEAFKPENTVAPCKRIVKRLGMAGEKDYRYAAFLLLQADLLHERLFPLLDGIDFDTEIEKIRSNLLAVPGAELPAEWEANMRTQFNKRKEALLAEAKGKDRDPLTFAQKIDWMLDAWERSAEKQGPSVTRNMMQLPYLLGFYPQFVKILRESGREADIARLDAAIDKAGKDEPQVFIQMAQMSPNPTSNASPLAELLGFPTSHPVVMGNIALSPAQAGAAMREPVDYVKIDEEAEKLFAVFKNWLLKAKDAMLEKIRSGPVAGAASRMYGGYGYPGNWYYPFASLFSGLLQQRLGTVHELLPPPEFGENLSNPRGRITPYHVGSGTGVVGTLDLTGEKRPISQAELDRLFRIEREIHRALDLAFAWNKELAAARAEREKEMRNDRADRRTRQLRNVFTGNRGSHYGYQFHPRQEIRGYDVQQTLYGYGSSGEEVALVRLGEQFAAQLDRALAHFTPGEGVAEERLIANHAERFAARIAELEKSGGEETRRAFELYRFTKEHGNDNSRKIDPGSFAERLEAELREAIAGCGVDPETGMPDLLEAFRLFPPQRMLFLARLYAALGRLDKTIAYIDMLPLASAADIKQKELLFLQIYQVWQDYSDNGQAVGRRGFQALRKRAEIAVDRLLGYQFGEQEQIMLRQGLIAFGRLEEANMIRSRLLATTNNLNTMYGLLSESEESGESHADEMVRFALRVFRDPYVSGAARRRGDDMESRLRDRAILILKRFDKLDEIIGQLETQLAAAPGSFDLRIQLADIYARDGRKEEARQIALELENAVPDDPGKIQTYALLLASLDLADEAARWNEKYLAKNPEQFFNDFWEQERKYREAKQIDKLIAVLKNMKPELLMRFYNQYSSALSNWGNNEETREAAHEFFEYLWNLPGITDEEREVFRYVVLTQGRIIITTSNRNAQNQKYIAERIREVLFASMRIPEKKESDGNRATAVTSPFAQPSVFLQQHGHGYRNVPAHQVRGWSNDRAQTLATQLLDVEGRTPKALRKLRDEIKPIVAAHEAVDATQRDWNRYVSAKVLTILIDIRLGKIKEAVGTLDELVLEPKTDALLRTCLPEIASELQAAGLVLGQVDATRRTEALEAAIRCYEKHLERSGSDESMNLRLIALYLQSGKPGRGRGRAIAELEKNMKLLRMMGREGQVQIDNRYYHVSSVLASTDKLLSTLREAGVTEEPLRIYLKECRGRPWVGEMLKNRSGGNPSTFKKILATFEELLEAMSVEDMAGQIELFIPLLPEEPKPSEKSDGTPEEKPRSIEEPVEPVRSLSYLFTMLTVRQSAFTLRTC